MKQALIALSLLFSQVTFAKAVPKCVEQNVDFLIVLNTEKATKEDLLAVLKVGNMGRVVAQFPTLLPASGSLMLLVRPSANSVRVETLEETQELMNGILAPLMQMPTANVVCNFPLSPAAGH